MHVIALLRRVVVGLAIFVALPLFAQAKIEVRFGILAVDAAGQEQFVETDRVPNVVGQSYGWIATIEPLGASVTWTEELKLPIAPLTWDVNGALKVAISDDRTTVHTSGVLLAGESEFSSLWSITPGDPNGAYSILVKVSDGVVAEHTFNVVPTN